MKKVLGLVLLGAAGVFIVFMTGCEIPIVDTPTGFTGVATDNGAGVKLSWNAVTVEGEDVTYVVSFEGTELMDGITVTEYIDTDPDKADKYEVIAVAGAEESDPAEFSTEPITIESKSAWELNGSGKSGIEFSIAGKTINTHSMADVSHAAEIDCYFTNWTPKSGGFGGEYSLASPDEAPDDPGGVELVGTTGWRKSGVSDGLGAIEDVTLVPGTEAQVGELNYSNYTDITINEAYAVSTQDNYFGIIEATNIDEVTGEVSFKVTFQPIQGLRLF